jgi:hypothetical protein
LTIHDASTLVDSVGAKSSVIRHEAQGKETGISVTSGGAIADGEKKGTKAWETEYGAIAICVGASMNESVGPK